MCIHVYERKCTEVGLGGDLCCCLNHVHLWVGEGRWGTGASSFIIQYISELVQLLIRSRQCLIYSVSVYCLCSENMVHGRNAPALVTHLLMPGAVWGEDWGRGSPAGEAVVSRHEPDSPDGLVHGNFSNRHGSTGDSLCFICLSTNRRAAPPPIYRRDPEVQSELSPSSESSTAVSWLVSKAQKIMSFVFRQTWLRLYTVCPRVSEPQLSCL